MDVRRHVHYWGTVQGVGFRYTAARVARRWGVAGFVRNLPDGAVELVAEGDAEGVKGLLGEIREAMGAYIRDVRVTEEPPTGGFKGFEVRF